MSDYETIEAPTIPDFNKSIDKVDWHISSLKKRIKTLRSTRRSLVKAALAQNMFMRSIEEMCGVNPELLGPK